MNRATHSLAALAASLSLVPCAIAQNVLPASPAYSPDCQVTMHVNFDGRAVAHNPHEQPWGILLHLTLLNQQPTAARSATVIIHGYSSKGCLSPVSHQDTCPELTKTIELPLHLAPTGRVSTELKLPTEFTAVKFVDLTSVTWDNGTTWRPAQSCKAAPNGAVLVSSR